MRSGAAIAVLLITLVGACNPATKETPTPTASEPRLTSPIPSQPPGAELATYSKDRISFRYPSSWRLVTLGQGGAIINLYSPDYHDDGGFQIHTIQQGAMIVVSQTDIPQIDVTTDNYASRFGVTDGAVVVINGRRVFQYTTQHTPWFDSTSTVFFRDDGTQVEVDLSYPSGHDATHFQNYVQLLTSLVIQ